MIADMKASIRSDRKRGLKSDAEIAEKELMCTYMTECLVEIDLERDVSDPYVAQVYAQKLTKFTELSDAEDAMGVSIKDKQHSQSETPTMESIREANPYTLKEYMASNPIG
tara:strand:- start:131 stop:463 length:333 start_codon:yes stop_codon:yes gene_type:complete